MGKFTIGSKSQPRGLGCSMLGLWGSRTKDGNLYTGRNVDYMPDTGIAKQKLLVVHHPPRGIAHVDIGWAGVWGALAGMSAAGITVHEANLESNDVTFNGYGWILRMREVMTHSTDLKEALTLWNNTGNTIGFNHGIGSAKDRSMLVLETMAHNTAVFGSMDPRESQAALKNGNPRPDSVWRTNHGYDAYTISHTCGTILKPTMILNFAMISCRQCWIPTQSPPQQSA